MKRAAPSNQHGRRPRKKASNGQSEHGNAGKASSSQSVHVSLGASSNSHAQKETIANKPRPYTVSVAISASMIAQLEKPELRTFLAGQIARTLTVMQVDEVVVYEDALIPASGSATATAKSTEGAFESASKKNFDATVFLARILQFCECPPYLRKALFPIHRDLQFAGMINLESPHHTRIDDPIAFREGVTLEATRKDGTLVDCGLRNSIPAFIKDKAIKPGVRVTIKLSNPNQKISFNSNLSSVPATVVSPNHPRETTGVYWGYNVRLAGSIGKVLSESSYEGGYDVTIGVSELANLVARKGSSTLLLLTHNMLMCHVKGCSTDNFPLRIEDAEMEQVEVEFNDDFCRRLINKIDWPAFVQTAFALGLDQLPASLPESLDEEFLQRIHKLALESVDVPSKLLLAGYECQEGKRLCNIASPHAPPRIFMPAPRESDSESSKSSSIRRITSQSSLGTDVVGTLAVLATLDGYDPTVGDGMDRADGGAGLGSTFLVSVQFVGGAEEVGVGRELRAPWPFYVSFYILGTRVNLNLDAVTAASNVCTVILVPVDDKLYESQRGQFGGPYGGKDW
ncbi:hypothetical protein CcCBS67573_g08546 [Chytriomyces confervae]|uniref:Uncharacterized protein n=1 Tax=Chytriomyces confervae TaxID=246404 RepID=A0A507EKW2_9FUNG|nr:hypothetical protein CcCBS67573_g08546 [Chytriomyces confervae]